MCCCSQSAWINIYIIWENELNWKLIEIFRNQNQIKFLVNIPLKIMKMPLIKCGSLSLLFPCVLSVRKFKLNFSLPINANKRKFITRKILSVIDEIFNIFSFFFATCVFLAINIRYFLLFNYAAKQKFFSFTIIPKIHIIFRRPSPKHNAAVIRELITLLLIAYWNKVMRWHQHQNQQRHRFQFKWGR